MADLNLKSFDPLYPMRIHQYNELLNDANVDIMDKVNAVIDYLNQVGKLTNDVVKDWNVVYQWVMNDGLTQDVSNKLEQMLANHEFDSLISTIVAMVGDLTLLTTTSKDTIVNAINSLKTELNTSIGLKANQTDLTATNNKLGDLTALQTADKDTLVHAINDNVTSLTQKISKGELVVNIMDYGAKGDGVTDDTQSLINAIAYIKTLGGGTLFIPRTINYYWIQGEAVLCDNLHVISNGAILKKRNYTSPNIFTSRSYANTGYGSGANNVIIEGLEFQGNFDTTEGCSNTLHHARNITVRNCIFRECVVSGHAWDLDGCRDMTFDNCTFYGMNKQSGREFTEAIQLDYSSAISAPSVADTDTFDGLPTMNVIVQNCKFLPYTKGGITYPAPNAFGSHSRLKDQYFKSIKFINNYIEDAPNTDGATTHIRGWVHFYHADGVTIENNTFVSTTTPIIRAMSFVAWNTALTVADVNNASATESTYTPQPCKNVTIRNNTFKGFSNSTSDSGLIYVEGYDDASSVTQYAENIVFDNNKFIDCYNVANVTSGNYNIGCDLINITKSKTIKIINNHTNNVRRLVNATYVIGMNVLDNTIIYAYWNPVNIGTSSKDVIVSNNILKQCGSGLYFFQVDGLTVRDNRISDELTSAYSSYGNIIAVKTCTRVNVNGNDLNGLSGTQYVSISLYTTCDRGFVKNNIVTNYGAISVSVDSTNITNAENA